MRLLDLFIAYGLTFGLQNKAPFLRGKTKFSDALLKCVYCTGFHAGWITWVSLALLHHSLPSRGLIVPTALMWAFGSSAFCYVVDTGVRWLERPAAK
jgi:hypothetical protein